MLSGVRARMRDDLDAPGALAVVDQWADALLAVSPADVTPAGLAGARLVRDTVDALLGIQLQPPVSLRQSVSRRPSNLWMTVNQN
jgi:L-cysteine:1D-myo-inositol 2-amino-2-deoxy-alpha-D-glucopyranoside ligase